MTLQINFANTLICFIGTANLCAFNKSILFILSGIHFDWGFEWAG